MRYSVVNYQTVLANPDFRIDAEYSTHSLSNSVPKSKVTFVPLQSLLKRISSGHTPYKHDVSVGDVDFVTVECIGDLTLNENRLKHITQEQYDVEFKSNRIIENSVLCTIKRRICKAFPFIESPRKAMAMNQDVAFLIPNDKIDSAYLATYLCCKTGQAFADRQKTEQMNPYISVANLSQLPIAILSNYFQQLIRQVFISSLKLFNESQKADSQAEQILLFELGLSNWKPKQRLTFVKNYSDIQSSERIDAEYFQPKYDEVIKLIKQYKNGFDTLGNVVKLNNQIFNPAENQKYKYIELANIGNSGQITDYSEYFGKDLPTRARRNVRSGDVVVSSIEGSLDKIALVGDELDNALCSTGFHVIRSEKINSETLLCLLKNIIGHLQLKQGCSGTILTAINDEAFQRILLPVISKPVQEMIKTNISSMYETQAKSKKLLEIAKIGVEKAIEQDEASAIKWINSELLKIEITER